MEVVLLAFGLMISFPVAVVCLFLHAMSGCHSRRHQVAIFIATLGVGEATTAAFLLWLK